MNSELGEGPVTFERFMEHCLYDPRCGYYRRQAVFGKQGDFFTSPYTHRFFAETLARAFAAYYRELGCPRPFHLVEFGAGEGILGTTILEALAEVSTEASDACRYFPVEIDSGGVPERIRGVVFSNEFFDALPVHRVRVRGTGMAEIYVQATEDGWSEHEGELSDPNIVDYMRRAFKTWRDGWIYEVNLRMVALLRELDPKILSAFVVSLDYGYDWRTYDSVERPDGTLLCYCRHRAGTDPYVRVGRQDLTSHVSFEVMKSVGEELGWRNGPLISQRRYLMNWGLADRLLEEEKKGLFRSDQIEARLGLKSLLMPGGISDTVQVLVQEVRV